MILVTHFCATDGGEAVKITVDVDGEEETYVVSAADHFTLSLRKGEIDGETYVSLRLAADHYKAVRLASSLSAHSPCSAKRLFGKLRQRGISAGDAQYAVEFLLRIGFLDEHWQIQSYLADMVGKKHMGRRKVVPALLQKGYPSAKINAVLEAHYTENDFSEAKRAFLLKKFGKTSPATREEAETMKKALYKWGF